MDDKFVQMAKDCCVEMVDALISNNRPRADVYAEYIAKALQESYRMGSEEKERDLNHRSRSVHACELGMKEAFKEGMLRAAEIAEKDMFQPGAVIEVNEVRRVEPFLTDREISDHIAKRIRAKAKEIEK